MKMATNELSLELFPFLYFFQFPSQVFTNITPLLTFSQRLENINPKTPPPPLSKDHLT